MRGRCQWHTAHCTVVAAWLATREAQHIHYPPDTASRAREEASPQPFKPRDSPRFSKYLKYFTFRYHTSKKRLWEKPCSYHSSYPTLIYLVEHHPMPPPPEGKPLVLKRTRKTLPIFPPGASWKDKPKVVPSYFQPGFSVPRHPRQLPSCGGSLSCSCRTSPGTGTPQSLRSHSP